MSDNDLLFSLMLLLFLNDWVKFYLKRKYPQADDNRPESDQSDQSDPSRVG